MSDKDRAVLMTQAHPKLPKGAIVSAGELRGGCAIFIQVPGKEREAFIDRTYAAAAYEVDKWLYAQEEVVPVRKGNRHERRAAEAAMRRGKPN